MPQVSPQEWEAFISRHSAAHLLQTGAWGELKSAFGWEPAYILNEGCDIGAQVLLRRLPFGLLLAYIPKGPVGSIAPRSVSQAGSWLSFQDEVDRFCLERAWSSSKLNRIFGRCLSRGTLLGSLWSQQIQPPVRLVVDLSGDEVPSWDA
jgi:hypothetical protein